MEVAAISAADGNSTCTVYEITGTRHKVRMCMCTCSVLGPLCSLMGLPFNLSGLARLFSLNLQNCVDFSVIFMAGGKGVSSST